MKKHGIHGAKIGEKNRLRIWKFLKDNPGTTQKKCAECIGLSPITVHFHVKAIRHGWRPEGE